MGLINIKKGLDVPIKGEPEQKIRDEKPVNKVAVVGPDYVGMKPTMEVQVGDRVKLGQVLFADKKMPQVRYTAPGSGDVIEVNRGHKRALLSVVIQLEGEEEITYESYPADQLSELAPEKIKVQLLNSGLWTSLRMRPFSKVADPDSKPHSIFVTAMDTNPLAPSLAVALKGREEAFKNGLVVLSRLTEGTVFLCKSPDEDIPVPESKKISVHEFTGPHPAGLVGTHIHFLDPVSRMKTVWYINAQDVAAIGNLFTTGKIDVERVVSLAGPSVQSPTLLKTRVGACLTDLVEGELQEGGHRVISGSVLSGRTASDALQYLGRFHQQITVLPEGGDRHFLGWLSPGFNLYSLKNIVASKFFPNKTFAFSTTLNGDRRPIVPSGSYEAVMPLDILATPLMRALAISDVEESEKLGCYELDEEDLALITFVCPSKIDHGANLRTTLDVIEKEG